MRSPLLLILSFRKGGNYGNDPLSYSLWATSTTYLRKRTFPLFVWFCYGDTVLLEEKIEGLVHEVGLGLLL